ncbi:hypothetical protein FQZ97_1067150 [compost metagenome]
MPQRQQQAQAGRGQRDPQGVDALTRGEEGHRQGSAELNGHSHAERNALQRLVEHQVHATQRHAVAQQALRVGLRQRPAPGPPDQQQQQRGKAHAQGRGAQRADLREQLFGEGCADAQRDDGAEHGEQGQGLRPAGSVHGVCGHREAMGWLGGAGSVVRPAAR